MNPPPGFPLGVEKTSFGFASLPWCTVTLVVPPPFRYDSHFARPSPVCLNTYVDSSLIERTYQPRSFVAPYWCRAWGANKLSACPMSHRPP
ncbi:hypothetical protein BFJ67_g17257 [Fusarium oxysporum f. sp. cepae]|nr:hypothetical protein BFJ67_g17257 [Fusarium oxysporum f. sp. cepae]